MPQHWGFWGTLAWGTGVAITFVVLQIATVLSLERSGNEDGTLFSLATFATTAILCPLILGIIRLKPGSQIRDYLALRPVDAKVMLRWFGALAVVLLLSDLLTLVLRRPIVPDAMAALYQTAHPVWLFWLALVFAAPLFEEMFFRGFLFKGLESSFLGTAGTIVVTAGVWAAIHQQYDAYGIATIFVLGLLLGAARAQGGTLLLPLGMHATANLVAAIETATLGSATSV